MAKIFMVLGALIFLTGAILYFGGKSFGVWRLPGDIIIERENFSFYFPIMTSIIASIIFTVVLNFLFFRR